MVFSSVNVFSCPFDFASWRLSNLQSLPEKLPEHAGIFATSLTHKISSVTNTSRFASHIWSIFATVRFIKAESDRSENWHMLQFDWFATVNRCKPIRNRQMLQLATVSYCGQSLSGLSSDSGWCIIVAHC